jgi:hypothetical protein
MTTRLAIPAGIVLALALALTLALLMAHGIHAGAAAPNMHYYE